MYAAIRAEYKYIKRREHGVLREKVSVSSVISVVKFPSGRAVVICALAAYEFCNTNQ